MLQDSRMVLVALLFSLSLGGSLPPCTSEKPVLPCLCGPSNTSIGPFKGPFIGHLDSSLFEQCDHITSLDLSAKHDDFDILTVASNAFTGFRKLRSLNLDDNSIRSLPNSVFASLVNLKTLELSNNWLTKVPDLSGLVQLNDLDLSKNSFELVPGLSLPSLTILNLEGNYIGFIDSGAFSKLPNLITLNLMYNRLQTLTEGTFTGLSSLSMLDLTGQMLFFVDYNVWDPLADLTVLNMSNNPSKCYLPGGSGGGGGRRTAAGQVTCDCAHNMFQRDTELNGGAQGACLCLTGQYLYTTPNLELSYSRTCLLCPIGTYNNRPGASKCANCTGEHSARYTSQTGSNSSEECIPNPSIKVL